MKYQPFIERSIARHGYVKPEYAPDLAIMMEELEGKHPHQIARAFRQIGTQLPTETKKLLGIRCNADMTEQAMNALTQRGLSEPLKGLEITLLDASFDYFRHRAAKDVNRPEFEGYASLYVDSWNKDCPGCLRMKGQKVGLDQLDQMPPSDCANEACNMTVRLHIDFTRRAVDRDRAGGKLRKSFGSRIGG